MKLFVVSDIHGFYDEFVGALYEAGFKANDPNMLLICLGDYTDRGTQPFEVMKFLMGLTNCVLCRGNHEGLLEECCKRGVAYMHDYSNGTYGTICELGGAGLGRTFEECCIIAEQKVKPFFDKMVNYYETKNYIFVHSFVPLTCLDDMPKHYTRGRVYEKMENWREAHQSDWEAAMWGNPFDLAKQGLLPNKTLVFGHFHTSYPRAKYEGQAEFNEEWSDFSPYFGDGYIGIDACTAFSGKVNVLVLEDELI